MTVRRDCTAHFIPERCIDYLWVLRVVVVVVLLLCSIIVLSSPGQKLKVARLTVQTVYNNTTRYNDFIFLALLYKKTHTQRIKAAAGIRQ